MARAHSQAERLAALATLGRVGASASVSALGSAIAECAERLRACCAAASTAAPESDYVAPLAALHEELELLVRLSGHLLADGAEGGDTPEVPPEVAAAPAGADTGGVHPAEWLVGLVLAELAHQAPPRRIPRRASRRMLTAYFPRAGVTGPRE